MKPQTPHEVFWLARYAWNKLAPLLNDRQIMEVKPRTEPDGCRLDISIYEYEGPKFGEGNLSLLAFELGTNQAWVDKFTVELEERNHVSTQPV